MYRPLWSQPYPRHVVFKWFLMAFIAGNINAGGFMACKRFVTHVTGFATWFGLEAANGDWTAALGMLSVPFYFLTGVMVAAYFTDAAIAKGRKPRFGLVMGGVSTLLFGVALAGYFDVFGIFGRSFELESDYPMLVLLSTASGLLNASITCASGGLMRSTHMTGTTTDLGIGLVRALFGHSQPALQKKEFYRNWLRAGTVVCFVLGSLVGAVLFMTTKYLGFVLPGLLAVYIGNLGVRATAAADATPAKPSDEPTPLRAAP